MKKVKSLILLIAVCIIAAYLLLTYNSLFQRRVGFIYHPETDFLLKLYLKPEVHKWSKWKYLIPFANPDGYRIAAAQWVGEFGELKSAQEKMETIRTQAKEMIEDPAKMQDVVKQITSDLSPEKLKEAFSEALFVEIYHYAKVITADVFPHKGGRFEFLLKAPSKELEKVDAVITVLGLEEPRVKNVFVLHGGVLITGNTALLLENEIMF
jgi:hypothetical protein